MCWFFLFLVSSAKKQQNNNLSPSSPSPQTPELPHHQGRWRTTLENYIWQWEGASNRSGTSILQIQNHANTHPVATENSGLVPSYHRGNAEFRRKHLAFSKVDTFPAEEMLGQNNKLCALKKNERTNWFPDLLEATKKSVKFPWIENLGKNVKFHPLYHLNSLASKTCPPKRNIRNGQFATSFILQSWYFRKTSSTKKMGYNGVCGFMSREGWKIFPELTSFIVDI